MNIKNLLLAFLLCQTSIIYAETSSTTQLTLSPILLYFDYTEFNTDDQVLDRELGWLPGLELDIKHKFASDWSINLFGAYYQGTIDYDGQTQSGTPHTTITGTKLFRLGGRIEKGVYKKLRLYVGAQHHQWDRSINDTNSVSGLDETYKWLEYAFGLHSDFPLDERNIINLDIAYLLIQNATIDVDLSRISLGSAKLDIADGNGGRFKLSWKSTYTENIRLGLSFFFEAWDFGRSDTKQTQGGSRSAFVTEPRSETQNSGLMINFEYML